MLNRRLYYDDDKGVTDILNETDSSGRGISVPATFYMQIGRRGVGLPMISK